MVDLNEAINIVRKNLPFDWSIHSYIQYNNLFVFKVFNTRPGEEELDPFYSVDIRTGVFDEFSVLTDGDPVKVISAFTNAVQMPVGQT